MASQPQNVPCITLDAGNDNVGYPKTLLRKLHDASLIGEDTDVVLVFGKFDEDAPTVHVHSSILKSESSVFKAWMNAECLDTELIKSADGKTNISLPDDDPEEFKSFLKLMYRQQGLIEKDEIHSVVLPAFKMAKKYGALDVTKICEEECFPALIENFCHLNVAQVYTFAQKYGLTSVTDAVFAFVKENLNRILVHSGYEMDWVRSSEEMLVRLLSTDSCRIDRCCVSSDNEYLLCTLASMWLQSRRELDWEQGEEDAEGRPSSPKRVRVTDMGAIAVRVYQNIRFRELSSEQLRQCLWEIRNFLTPHQIGTICLVWSGVSQDQISDRDRDGAVGQFIVDTRRRFL